MATKFFHPKVHMGWHKDLAMSTRRRKALKAHKGDNLATARALQALANVTQDKVTRQKAQADANYFYKRHAKTGK